MKKGFTNLSNENAFTKYEELKRSDGMSSPSINQYRSAVYTLEEVLQSGTLNTITVADIEKARILNPTKVNHLNGFIIDTFNADIVNYSSDVVLACMGTRERLAMIKLLGGTK